MTDQTVDHTCRVCMHDINNVTTVKGCSHAFCYECVHQWTSSRKNPLCPICRLPIATLVLSDGSEETPKSGSAVLAEEADLSCLDHRYFLGEVSRLLSRANSVQNQLYSSAYGCGRKGGSRQLQQQLDSIHDVQDSLNRYRNDLQNETRFDPEVMLQELYRLDRQVTSAQSGSTGHGGGQADGTGGVDGDSGQYENPAAAATAAEQHYDDSEDYYEGSSDDDHREWHQGLAKTPGRRPTSRHVNNGIKTRPDRGLQRNAQQQRQQRR